MHEVNRGSEEPEQHTCAERKAVYLLELPVPRSAGLCDEIRSDCSHRFDFGFRSPSEEGTQVRLISRLDEYFVETALGFQQTKPRLKRNS
jgi:hypothetical protein